MKAKHSIAGFIVAVVAVFSSCSMGPTGKDGSSWIKYSWSYNLNYLSTDDPSFGETVYNDRYEKAYAGTWNVRYTAWNYASYAGKYTVYVNKGSSGVLFSSGANGADTWFEVYLSSTGPYLYTYSSARSVSDSNEHAVAEERSLLAAGSGVEPPESSEVANDKASAIVPTSSTYEHTQVVTSGDYTVVLEYSQVR